MMFKVFINDRDRGWSMLSASSLMILAWEVGGKHG